ncbi:unnamed protein product [Paramecium sonneborni]|uniref:Uncharacterized protein n=1 Tax=Paramecium sonneborni TaxID=65129 RepID=A0A8S1PXE2_9CILI|nr:unnamed protein product [Paramecium sonneborni]
MELHFVQTLLHYVHQKPDKQQPLSHLHLPLNMDCLSSQQDVQQSQLIQQVTHGSQHFEHFIQESVQQPYLQKQLFQIKS